MDYQVDRELLYRTKRLFSAFLKTNRLLWRNPRVQIHKFSRFVIFNSMDTQRQLRRQLAFTAATSII